MGGVMSDHSIVDEMNERSNRLIAEHVAKIPADYQRQKDHIVNEMHKSSPNDFHGLNIKDYPEKNEKQVNKLAIHNVTSDQVKYTITHEIYREIDPTIDEKTQNLNKVAKIATKKAIHLAVKKAVEVAVNNTQAQLERQFGVDSNKNKKNSMK
ncbi:unnamed protein product [Rotaria sp. Silwood2]|nr:unnamed protein product [Rotaria sp. Silwood2]CAF2939102.1 unnamed protein product [Rotaria sp. Silwood2]CAF3203598.1 unnamed protein product [Rotaria sp. Silwood2]CAF3351980.1 unnamed protein product [Rotaria sp. Silwood2]CAF4363873.1 unnamed protein product [Rotaria sp. Silwood2]